MSVMRRRYSALLSGCIMTMCCGSVRQRMIGRSPDGSCRVVVSDVNESFFSFDSRLVISVESGGSRRIVFQGDRDWRFQKARIRWSSDSKMVEVLACSEISSPVLITYDVKQSKVHTSDDFVRAFRDKPKSATGGERPLGCRDVSDPALWYCCARGDPGQ
jgi:hypothetical protein